MRIRLSSHSKSFATREIARQILADLSPSDRVEVDLGGVMVSPSFLAELLGGLASAFGQVEVLAPDDFNAALAGRLAAQLSLTNVRVAQVA